MNKKNFLLPLDAPRNVFDNSGEYAENDLQTFEEG